MKNQEQDPQKLLQKAIANLMKTSEGRYFLRHIIQSSHALYCEYSSDVNAMYYVQGQRKIGFEVINLLKAENENNLAKILNHE